MGKSKTVESSNPAARPGKFIDDLTREEILKMFPQGNPGELKVDETTWKTDWKEGVEATGERWKRRTAGTKKDIVALAIKAEPKYKQKMEDVIKNESRAKALGRTNTAAVLAAVEATSASEFVTGATKRAGKFGTKISAQYPLRVYAKTKMDAMPEGTDAQREKKMIAARRTNIAIGLFLKGVKTDSETRAAIDAACTGA
jgi:hypothetical protein